MQNNREIIDVGISEFKVVSNDYILRTSGIGSCVAVTLYDSVKKIGGLAHSMLPGSIQSNPKYVGSAIELMIKKMELAGADIKNLEAKIVGGADMFASGAEALAKANCAERSEANVQDPENSSQDIGIKNVQTAIEQLNKRGIKVVAKDAGKNHGRSVEFNIATGMISVKWHRQDFLPCPAVE